MKNCSALITELQSKDTGANKRTYVGGLCGEVTGSGSVLNCYASVSLPELYKFGGQLIGNNAGMVFSYYNSDLNTSVPAAQSNTGTLNVISKITAEIKTQTFCNQLNSYWNNVSTSDMLIISFGGLTHKLEAFPSVIPF